MHLSLDDTRHLEASEGWIGLGDYIEANQELERISSERRVHPAALKIRWQIFVAARRWTATLEIATALTKLAPADADNLAASGNGATTLLFHFERPCRAVPEQRRWAHKHPCYRIFQES